jgi:pyruvate-formate lyase-activating enzyme
MGNIMDPAFREIIRSGTKMTFPCHFGTCISECDGHHYSQTIVGKNGLVEHVAERSETKGIDKQHHCNIMVNITSICNYNCSYCCAEASMKEYAGRDMKEDAWEDVARFFTEVFPTGNASMLGGEPTVHKGLKGCVRTFLKGGWYVDLFTNLSFPNRVVELVEDVGDKLPKLFVIVSVHPTQSQFSVKKIVDGVNKLASMNIEYGYSFVCTPENDRLDKEQGIFNTLKTETKPQWISHIRDVHQPIIRKF